MIVLAHIDKLVVDDERSTFDSFEGKGTWKNLAFKRSSQYLNEK
jgi:hypothetical protein